MKFKAHADTQQVTRLWVIIVLLIWPTNAPKVHVSSVFYHTRYVIILGTKVLNINETDKQILKNICITLTFLKLNAYLHYIIIRYPKKSSKRKMSIVFL